MYQASAPLFLRALDSLSAILKKGEALGDGIVDARLAPDMLTLAGQIQRATDSAKGCMARLADIPIPSFPDTEKTLAELHARIAKTVEFIKSVPPAKIDGSENLPVVVGAGPRELKFKGEDYLLSFALPNFYFHITTAYAILRNKGVEIGKRDYLGRLALAA
jgi:hypothetical protein